MTEEHAPLYDLVDPRPIAERSPYTFFLPSAAEIAAVSIGDLVKLTFEYPHETEKWGAERMWVVVEKVSDNKIAGVLDNHPSEPTTSLKAGAIVRFARHNIISVRWANPDAAPRPNDYREYWERCLVDQCVLDGEESVENLYREKPEPLREGDTYPDSGWRILGRQGDLTNADMDARKISYVALGAVLNVDDSWLDWIDAPVGTYISRDFKTNTYSQVEWTP